MPLTWPSHAMLKRKVGIAWAALNVGNASPNLDQHKLAHTPMKNCANCFIQASLENSEPQPTVVIIAVQAHGLVLVESWPMAQHKCEPCPQWCWPGKDGATTHGLLSPALQALFFLMWPLTLPGWLFPALEDEQVQTIPFEGQAGPVINLRTRPKSASSVLHASRNTCKERMCTKLQSRIWKLYSSIN